MAQILIVLAHESEVEDFYQQFNADGIMRNMGWKNTFDLCDPDTERPTKEECRNIEQFSGLPSELIGDFSHYLGEFILDGYRDNANYDLPQDFTVIICSDDADIDKFKVYSLLKGVDIVISMFSATQDNLKAIYKIISDYFEGTATIRDVCIKLGW